MKHLMVWLRRVFGAFWLVFGLNGFLHFMPTPPASPEGAAFMQALADSGYMLPLIYGSQVVAGALLLANRYVTAGLLMLAPVVGNVLLYDCFLNPAGLAVGCVLAGLYAALITHYRRSFLPLLAK